MSKVKITAKSCYAPIRFEARYSVLREAFHADRKLTLEQPKSYYNDICFDASYDYIKNNYTKINTEKDAFIIMFDTFIRYLVGGKVIYEIDEILLSALSMSDISNIPCGVVQFPTSAFYIHLDKCSSIFEGVFVSTDDIAGKGKNTDEVIFDFIYPEFAQKPMEKSLEAGEPSESITLYFGNKDELVIDILREECGINLAMPLRYSNMERFNHLSDIYSEIEKLLTVILNTIFYINSVSSDVSVEWGRDISTDKIHSINQQGNTNIKKNLEKGLAEAGYSKVRYIGKQFSQTAEGKVISEYLNSGKKLATHFRRGHFRNQPFGKKLSQRKIVFIAPTVVNAGGELQGKIYKS